MLSPISVKAGGYAQEGQGQQVGNQGGYAPSYNVPWPTYNSIPQTNFDCASKKQPGFYADVETRCQVFRRCDINGNMTSFLCTNMTVFNQITLTCDYWYNVDCQKYSEKLLLS